MNAIDVAVICKALGDSNRLQIIQMLSDGEKCGCKLLETFEITQPTLSYHMKILCECGLVNARKEGKWQHYSLNYYRIPWGLQFFRAYRFSVPSALISLAFSQGLLVRSHCGSGTPAAKALVVYGVLVVVFDVEGLVEIISDKAGAPTLKLVKNLPVPMETVD